MLEGGTPVADMHKFSRQMIDLAQRLDAITDAVEGKATGRAGRGTRWVLLPAVGAGIYALATNGSFARRTRGAVEQVKARAADLPEDLLKRVRQTSVASGSNGGGSPRPARQRSRNARSGSSRARASGRKASTR